jgi:putative ABC transport system permease protein
MNLTNLTKIALKALNNNKLRCFLTMLGIIIGVASVITMLAIGQGSKRSIREQISEMGSNMIMIHPGNMERGGVRQDASFNRENHYRQSLPQWRKPDRKSNPVQ